MRQLNVTYAMEEKPTIPLTWKALHLLFYVLACVSGILASVFFQSILSQLDENCFLWATLKLKPTSGMPREKLEIDMLSTSWRPKESCEFYLYSHLGCSVFSVVWMVFFVMCARGGLGTDGYIIQPWRIVTPSLVFNLFAFAITLNASVNFHLGVSKFCTFDADPRIPKDHRLCHALKDVYIDNQRTLGISFVHDITNCLTTQWLNTVFWFMGSCWSVIRCLVAPDFSVVKITVLEAAGGEPNDAQYMKEEVIDITEPSPSTSQETIDSDKKTT